MNEQLQTALAELLTTGLDAMREGANFAQQQLPEVIEQLLLWQLWSHAVQFGVSMGAVVAVIAIWVHCIRYVRHQRVRRLAWRERDDELDRARDEAREAYNISIGRASASATAEALRKLDAVRAARREHQLDEPLSRETAESIGLYVGMISTCAGVLVFAWTVNLVWLQR